MKERNVPKEKQAGRVLIRLGNGNFQDSEGWKPVTSGTRRKVSSPADLQLQNRFSALAAEEGLGSLSSKASELSKPKPHRSTRCSGRLSAGGTEASICQPDLLAREICCLRGKLWKNC